MLTLNQNNRKNLILSLTISLIILMLRIPFCGLGIDLEDAVFHLFFSQNAVTCKGYTWTTCPLSNWLLGWWMSLAPIPRMVWWGYFGGAILSSIYAFLCLQIYFQLFPLRYKGEFWICLITLWASYVHFSRSLISYYTLPTTLTLLFFLLWIKSEKNHSSYKLYGMLGLISGILIFSRITFIVIAFLPFPFFVYKFYQCKERRKEVVVASLYFIVGLIIVMAVIFPFYWHWKLKIEQFSIESELSYVNVTKRLKILIRALWSLGVDILPRNIGYICILCCLAKYFNRYKKIDVLSIILNIIIFAYICMKVYQYYVQNLCYSYFGSGLMARFSFDIVPFALCYCIYFVSRYMKHHISSDFPKMDSSQLYPLVLFLAFCSFLIPLGSDVYLLKIGYLLPILLLIVIGLMREVPMKWFHHSILSVIIMFSMGAQFSYGYLNPIPMRCTSQSNLPELKFMRTSENRRNVIDESMHKICELTKGESELLLFSWMHYTPLYISGLQNWVPTGTTGYETLLSKIREKQKVAPLPRFALIEGDSHVEEMFLNNINAEYKCLFRSDALPNGKEQNFQYSLWVLEKEK